MQKTSWVSAETIFAVKIIQTMVGEIVFSLHLSKANKSTNEALHSQHLQPNPQHGGYRCFAGSR